MTPATTNKISHNLGITSPRILGAKLKKPSRKTIHKGFHVQNATTTNQSLPCLRQHNYLRWTAGRIRIIPNECEAIRLLVELGRKSMKGARLVASAWDSQVRRRGDPPTMSLGTHTLTFHRQDS